MLPPVFGGNKKCYHLRWEVTKNVTTHFCSKNKKVISLIDIVRTFYKSKLLIKNKRTMLLLIIVSIWRSARGAWAFSVRLAISGSSAKCFSRLSLAFSSSTGGHVPSPSGGLQQHDGHKSPQPDSQQQHERHVSPQSGAQHQHGELGLSRSVWRSAEAVRRVSAVSVWRLTAAREAS